jgi:hypothetical protein
MEYFSNKIEFNLLKNHILKDPLCDWFEIQSYLYQNFKKDDQSYYKNHILTTSNKYREDLFKEIIKKSNLNLKLNSTIDQTTTSIKNNDPLIIGAKLYNPSKNMITYCDIVIRYDFFKKLFPKIDNLPFHILTNNNGYLLINVSYSSLHFKLDLKAILNDGNILYKKCSLYAFRESLFRLTGHKYPCFLLGKEYYYQKTHLPKDKFIGYIYFDETITKPYKKAYQWIQHLIKNYKKMKISPKPSHDELYPNMNYKESNWENEKILLANKIKEITLVWNISYDERCKFLEMGITSWDDINLLINLKETKKKKIQERMIHMNQQNDILIHPRKNISKDFTSKINDLNGIYFDVESFLSFDEKQNMSNNFDLPIIGILGFIYQTKYYDFTIQNYTNQEEKRNIQNFASKLHKISNDAILSIYHWGHAENNYFKYIHNKYPEISFPQYKLINILDYFRTEPIIVQGVFKFGLKSIGSALYKNKLIQTTWGENDNGLDSMIQFKEICKSNKKNIPLKRYIDIKNIVEYNRIDCQVLYEIVYLLRNKYLH